MSPTDKPIVWLCDAVRTPPFSQQARCEAGGFLRLLQRGDSLSMPHSRPMPTIGARCHELRINDHDTTKRIFYRIDSDAIVIADILVKKTRTTPKRVIQGCKNRFKEYDGKREEKAT